MLLALAVLLLALYWPAASLQSVFYVGDIYRLNYPARAVYALQLQAGRIPLWTPDALAGYPILGEGQTGAFYPLNLLLYRALPLPAALNYSVLLSFWIAGAGLLLYLRLLGLRRGPAFLAACAFMLGGFLPAHLNHLNMLSAVAWLPMLLWAVERATRSPRASAWAPVAAIFGLQGLAGHPQIMLMSAMLAVPYALAGPLAAPDAGLTPGRRMRHFALCFAALLAGVALAAVQLAPTYELTRLSSRAGGLDYDFFTSFSLPPAEFVTMLRPFIHGNPYPLVSQEWVGYVGALPLVLALLAPLHRRNRVVAYWLGVGIVAVALAQGGFNPAYHLLQHVPVLNSFRAPARYLLWLDLAIAVLAAVSADALLALTRPEPPDWRRWAPGLGLPLAAIAALGISRTPLEVLLLNWRWLPLVWLAATAALLLALRWRPPARLWLTLAAGLLLADLAAFLGVHNQTYNDVMPHDEFLRPPASLHFLQADAGPDPYRIHTIENWPGLPVMRESLYANIQQLYGVQSLNVYCALMPQAQGWLLDNLSPPLLDLLNVRYVLVPQHEPAEGPADFFVGEDPFAPSLTSWRFDLPGLPVAALEVEGFLLHCAGLPDGAPVGEVVLRGDEGERVSWTLRAGRELAEWSRGQGGGPQVVRTWPAPFGDPPRDEPGHTYLARWDLPQPLEATSVEVRALVPRPRLHLERLRLIDPAGGAPLLAPLLGRGDHVLVYCSPGVAIYRNEGVGPRAFLAHRARLAGSEEEARQFLSGPAFQPHQELILLEGKALAGSASPHDRVAVEACEPEYVRLRATTASPAYLVLADSHYPGWTARLNGRPAPILRAHVALRAVALPPGEHVVEFSFRPRSWPFAQWVSALGWLAVAGVVLIRRP